MILSVTSKFSDPKSTYRFFPRIRRSSTSNIGHENSILCFQGNPLNIPKVFRNWLHKLGSFLEFHDINYDLFQMMSTMITLCVLCSKGLRQFFKELRLCIQNRYFPLKNKFKLSNLNL